VNKSELDGKISMFVGMGLHKNILVSLDGSKSAVHPLHVHVLLTEQRDFSHRFLESRVKNCKGGSLIC
jgi:hypothetical protein